MARKRKWLKMNETINSLEDWKKIYSKLKYEIENIGIPYHDSYDDEYWFKVQVFNQKISGGWNSLAYGYSELDKKVKDAFERYGTRTLKLKVVINLEMWAAKVDSEN